MTYTSPVRRRARWARNVAAGSLVPAMWRHGVVAPATWWVGEANFGDDLTRWLLPKYGVLPLHRRPEGARVAAVGSILEMLPGDYRGAVWGSGLISDRPHPLPEAAILAVRGPLTRDLVGAPHGVALGDPGLLVARHFRRHSSGRGVGLVARLHHRSHAGFARLARSPLARTIDVRRTAPRVIADIARCEVILTTSLHGLVTADALGIPAAWTTLDPVGVDTDFKFRDYEAAVTPGASRHVPFDSDARLDDLVGGAAAAPLDVVESLVRGLERTAVDLRALLGDLPRFPFGVPRVMRSIK